MIFGVDYYPEHWEKELWERDATLMKEAGVNVVRIAEFGWSIIESTENHIDFSIFDNAINILARHGIKTIIGTPTATPPAWLCDKYPDIYNYDENGIKTGFGSRRHYCYNSSSYLKHVDVIVNKIGEHYKNNPHIIGYQIDNEIGHEGSDKCYCTNCRDAFSSWLMEKYKTLENLNYIWGTTFWSQKYTKWSQIPLPVKTVVAHNPSLELDYRRFMSHSMVSFQNYQIDILKKYISNSQFITHNAVSLIGGAALDLRKLSENLDFISYDNYPVWGGLEKPIPAHHNALLLSGIYGVKDMNFWVMEQLCGAQGHRIIGYLPKPGEVKLWSYQAIARGAEALIYFRWRAAHFGAEQFCHGIIDHDNIPKRKYFEFKEIVGEVNSFGDDLINSKPISQAAILHDYDNMWTWQIQQLSSAFNYKDELIKFYKPLFEKNVFTDVISQNSDISKYKLVVAPIMPMSSDDYIEKLKEYVNAGGFLILTYRTGSKDKNNLVVRQTLPGKYRELLGFKIDEYESLQTGQINNLIGLDGELKDIKFSNTVWSDIIECETSKPLATYVNSFFVGKAGITVNEYGNGKAYYIGCSPSSEALSALYNDIFKVANIHTISSPEGVEIVEKHSLLNTYRFIMNHTETFQDFKINSNLCTLRPFESIITKVPRK